MFDYVCASIVDVMNVTYQSLKARDTFGDPTVNRMLNIEMINNFINRVVNMAPK